MCNSSLVRRNGVSQGSPARARRIRLLNRSFVDKHGWLDEYDAVDTKVIGVSGVAVGTRQFTLPALTIGPYTLKNVPVTVMPDNRSTLELGLLGYEVLKHFQITMDLPKKRLHIQAVEQVEP